METITILVAGIFSTAVAYALAHVAPPRQGIINDLFVRIDHRAGENRLLNERSDGGLLHVLEHDDPDRAALRDHPKDGRLFLREGASTGRVLESPTAWRASLEPIGSALVPGDDIGDF